MKTTAVQLEHTPRENALCLLVQFLESLPDDEPTTAPASMRDDQRKPVIPHAMGQRAGRRPPVCEQAA